MTVSTCYLVECIYSSNVDLNLDVTIGFRPVNYTVNENQRTVTIFIQVLDGQLARSVEVDFTTEDGTATSTAPADYISPALPVTLQFTSDDRDQDVAVTIINDDIVENTERFNGMLSTIDRAVILGPDRATVEIIEDPNDGKPSLLFVQYSELT